MRCFIIQPFDKGTFDQRWEDVYEPVIRSSGFEPYRADQDMSAEVPIEEIEQQIQECEICFADITLDNPNVWYEVGYARAYSKSICAVCGPERTGKLPFDYQHRKTIFYQSRSKSDFDKLRTEMGSRLKHMAAAVTVLAASGKTATLKGPIDAGDLRPQEISALSIIAVGDDGTEPLHYHALLRSMDQDGYTPLAAKLSVETLKRKSLIESYTSEDRDSNHFTVLRPTDEGLNGCSAIRIGYPFDGRAHDQVIILLLS